ITFWDLNDPQNAGLVNDVNGDGRIDAGDILKPVAQGGWADGIDNDHDNYRDDLIGWNFVSNTNDPLDDNNHGTPADGTIAAIGNNGVGIAGINRKAQIMPLKSLNSSGSGSDSAAASAVYFAADHGARVSNNSWGGGSYDTTLSNAINYANNHGDIFVAAAGNSSRNTDTSPNYPSAYNLPNIIAVAAMPSSRAPASYCNYGAVTVELGAPGSGIYSTVRGGYATFSGTSMATPHVTGVVGLLLARNPTWTNSQIIQQILNTTTPDSALSGRTVTGGILN